MTWACFTIHAAMAVKVWFGKLRVNQRFQSFSRRKRRDAISYKHGILHSVSETFGFVLLPDCGGRACLQDGPHFWNKQKTL
jgi:hypothetical protein